jgi:hypothetical protein
MKKRRSLAAERAELDPNRVVEATPTEKENRA